MNDNSSPKTGCITLIAVLEQIIFIELKLLIAVVDDTVNAVIIIFN